MYKLGNLTIIFPNYNCDKRCPFCIAKNNKKFNNSKSENFERLSEKLTEFRNNNIRFERVVISGNGEPSLYSIEELEKCASVIKQNKDIFETLRVHTSGNLFWEKEKFNLFNELIPDVEFNILRLAISSKRDMQLLGYNKDYMQTDEFQKAKKIKFDIGLTKELKSDVLIEEIDMLLEKRPNIELIRFKNLMVGENQDSKQAKWVKDNRISKEEFVEFAGRFLSHYKCSRIENLVSKNGKRIIFEKSGNYPRDVVYTNGTIKNYEETLLDIQALKNMTMQVDKTRSLRYDDFDSR